ncbi:hypothetical protein [Streptomyces sp. HUAS ZL42]|uniref:hypothetical protein n=1 Tax=Streptomyces sp. HUAS ZL42 TaxID=3231715 RepID=UPI00345E2F75
MARGHRTGSTHGHRHDLRAVLLVIVTAYLMVGVYSTLVNVALTDRHGGHDLARPRVHPCFGEGRSDTRALLGGPASVRRRSSARRPGTRP